MALFSGTILVSMETGPKDQFWSQNDRFPNFLGNRSLLFSETFHDIELPLGLETDRAHFSGKILVSMETGHFQAQNMRFLNFVKNRSLDFPESFHDVKLP